MATDALLTGGGALAELSEETMLALNGVLPQHWSHGNPVDIIGDADAERYAKSLEIAAKEKDADGLLVIMTPQGMTDPVKIAEGLKNYASLPGKPILASWMGGYRGRRRARPFSMQPAFPPSPSPMQRSAPSC